MFSTWIRLDNGEDRKRMFLLKMFEHKDSRLAAKVPAKSSLQVKGLDQLF